MLLATKLSQLRARNNEQRRDKADYCFKSCEGPGGNWSQPRPPPPQHAALAWPQAATSLAENQRPDCACRVPAATPAAAGAASERSTGVAGAASDGCAGVAGAAGFTVRGPKLPDTVLAPPEDALAGGVGGLVTSGAPVLRAAPSASTPPPCCFSV